LCSGTKGRQDAQRGQHGFKRIRGSRKGACLCALIEFAIFHPISFQIRFARVCQYGILFGLKMFPEAMLNACSELDEDIPTAETILNLSYSETIVWLDSMGWTVEYIAAVMFMLMCVLGTLSNKTESRVMFASEIHHLA
jgi:hypothetical protein